MNKAAQSLGRMAAGKPKTYSADELEERKKRLAKARAKRWSKHRKTKQAKGASK